MVINAASGDRKLVPKPQESTPEKREEETTPELTDVVDGAGLGLSETELLFLQAQKFKRASIKCVVF